MKYFLRIWLAGSMVGWFVFASMEIGEPHSCQPGVISWTFPWIVLATFGATAFLGWFAAIEYMTEKKP